MKLRIVIIFPFLLKFQYVHYLTVRCSILVAHMTSYVVYMRGCMYVPGILLKDSST